MLVWVHTQFWTPVPVWSDMPWQFWASLAGSVASDVVYCFGLIMAYRLMDMSSAYPMMRALPLLLIVMITALFGMGEPLTGLAIVGMVMVFVGCLCMPLKKFSDFNWRSYLTKNMFFVLVTACSTTGYTVFDSLSQTIMGNAVVEMGISKPILSMTYYSTRVLVLSSILFSISVLVPSQRKHFKEIWNECRYAPLYAGLFASLTYIFVLIAMNYVTNVSYVQVFRQLGLIIGLFAGIFILKEKGALPKYIGVGLIVSGLILSVLN
jgi:drug/metabolite transporter (DMT)-like permease